MHATYGVRSACLGKRASSTMPGTRDRRHLRLIKAGRAKPWCGRVRESHRDLIIPLECVLPEGEREMSGPLLPSPLFARVALSHMKIFASWPTTSGSWRAHATTACSPLPSLPGSGTPKTGGNARSVSHTSKYASRVPPSFRSPTPPGMRSRLSGTCPFCRPAPKSLVRSPTQQRGEARHFHFPFHSRVSPDVDM